MEKKPSEVVHHSEPRALSPRVPSSAAIVQDTDGFSQVSLGCEERNHVTLEELMELNLMCQAFSSWDMISGTFYCGLPCRDDQGTKSLWQQQEEVGIVVMCDLSVK